MSLSSDAKIDYFTGYEKILPSFFRCPHSPGRKRPRRGSGLRPLSRGRKKAGETTAIVNNILNPYPSPHTGLPLRHPPRTHGVFPSNPSNCAIRQTISYQQVASQKFFFPFGVCRPSVRAVLGFPSGRARKGREARSEGKPSAAGLCSALRPMPDRVRKALPRHFVCHIYSKHGKRAELAGEFVAHTLPCRLRPDAVCKSGDGQAPI